MSKCYGNVVSPMGFLEKYGSDAVRYWAASARLGLDAAFDEQQMKIGRRLAIKVLNASKFALTMGGEDAVIDLDPALVTVPLDRSVLAALASVIDEASAALASYEHSRALEVTESFFWTFCDDYLELVKERAYNRDGAWDEASAASARAALAIVIDNVVRLLAPYLPYVTEEVWSWYREGSVHTAPWPVGSDLAGVEGDPSVLEAASSALIALRRVKSEAKVSPRTPFLAVTVRAPQAQVEALESVKGDLEAASKAGGRPWGTTGGPRLFRVCIGFELSPANPPPHHLLTYGILHIYLYAGSHVHIYGEFHVLGGRHGTSTDHPTARQRSQSR